jgi:hypothetical protein
MARNLLVALTLALAACLGPRPAAGGPALVHGVYFTLREDTPAARAALVESCTRLLAPIEGVVHFAAGERDPELARDVNDLEFDVALVLVFRDRAAHDRYQPHARHQAFIAENQANIARVRVFDSFSGAQ